MQSQSVDHANPDCEFRKEVQKLLAHNDDLIIEFNCKEGADAGDNDKKCKLIVAVTEKLQKALEANDRKYFEEAYKIVKKEFETEKSEIEEKLKANGGLKANLTPENIENNLKKWISKNGGEKNPEKIAKKLWDHAKDLEKQIQKLLAKNGGAERPEILALKYEIILVDRKKFLTHKPECLIK